MLLASEWNHSRFSIRLATRNSHPLPSQSIEFNHEEEKDSRLRLKISTRNVRLWSGTGAVFW